MMQVETSPTSISTPDRHARRNSTQRESKLQQDSRRRTREWDLTLNIKEDFPTAVCKYDNGTYSITVSGREFDQPITDYDPAVWDMLVQKMLTLHENAHVLYTDFEDLEERISQRDSKHKQVYHSLHNILEDGRIEVLIRVEYPTYSQKIMHFRANFMHSNSMWEDGEVGYTPSKSVSGLPNDDQCTAPNQDGTRCERGRHNGTDTCWQHDDEDAQTWDGTTTDQDTRFVPVYDAVELGLLDKGLLDVGRYDALLDPDNTTYQFKSDADRQLFIDEIDPLIHETIEAVQAESDPKEANKLIMEFVDEIIQYIDQADDSGKENAGSRDGESPVRPDDVQGQSGPAATTDMPDIDPDDESEDSQDDSAGEARDEDETNTPDNNPDDENDTQDTPTDNENGDTEDGDADSTSDSDTDDSTTNDTDDTTDGTEDPDDTTSDDATESQDDDDANGMSDSDTDDESEESQDGDGGQSNPQPPETLPDVVADIKNELEQEGVPATGSGDGDTDDESDKDPIAKVMDSQDQDSNLDQQSVNDITPPANPQHDDLVEPAKEDAKRIQQLLDLDPEKDGRIERNRRHGRVDGPALVRAKVGDTRRYKASQTNPDRLEFNLALVADRSTSMHSTERATGVSAILQSAYALDCYPHVNVAVYELYNNRVRRAMPLGDDPDEYTGEITHGNRSGNTPLSNALCLARDRLQLESGNNTKNRVFVVTDGNPTDESAYLEELQNTQIPVVGLSITNKPRSASGAEYYHRHETVSKDGDGLRDKIAQILSELTTEHQR